MHYMDGNKISEANRAAAEVCVLVEAGAAVGSMDLMNKEKKEKASSTSIWVFLMKSRMTSSTMSLFTRQCVVNKKSKA